MGNTISVTFKQIADHRLYVAMRKLVETPTNPYGAFRIRKLLEEYQKARETIDAAYRDYVVTPFAKKDAKGAPIYALGNPQHPHGFEVADGMANSDIEAVIADLDARTVILQATPLLFEYLLPFQFSAMELMTLAPFYQEPQERAGNVIPIEAGRKEQPKDPA